MLLAGAIACVVTYFNHYSFKDMLIVLIVVLVIFLFLGIIVRMILDSIHLPTSDAVKPDGEVIEKSEEEQPEGEAEEAAAEEENAEPPAEETQEQ